MPLNGQQSTGFRSARRAARWGRCSYPSRRAALVATRDGAWRDNATTAPTNHAPDLAPPDCTRVAGRACC